MTDLAPRFRGLALGWPDLGAESQCALGHVGRSRQLPCVQLTAAWQVCGRTWHGSQMQSHCS